MANGFVSFVLMVVAACSFVVAGAGAERECHREDEAGKRNDAAAVGAGAILGALALVGLALL